MFASKTEHQIRKTELAFVANFFFFAQARERRAICGPRFCKSVSALAVGNSILPIQLRTSGLLEIWNDLTEFRVNTAAVVALVIVFHQDFPISGDVVVDTLAGSKLGERIARNSLDRGPKLGAHAVFLVSRIFGIQVKEEETSPGVHSNGIKRKIFLAETFGVFQKGSAEKLAVQIVGPLVIGATDNVGRCYA